jgi:hypothetical protein
MAWDATKPAASGYLVSADIRSNWAAIADQAMGRNLLGDPEFLIWGSGTSGNAPSWWNLTGQTSDGNIKRVDGTTTDGKSKLMGKSGVKLTYDSALTLYQNVLSTADITTSVKAPFDGQAVSAAGWVFSGSNDCKLQLNGPASTVLSSAVPASTWTWLTRTLELNSSTMTRLGMGIRLNAAGSACFTCPTLVLGPIAPDYFIPGESRYSDTVIGLAYTTSIPGKGGNLIRYRPTKPIRVEGFGVDCMSALSCAYHLGLDKYNGTSWIENYTCSARAIVGPTPPQYEGSSFDGAYHARCIEGVHGMTSGLQQDGNRILGVNTAKNSATGARMMFYIRYLTYEPPLQTWRANYHTYK